MRPSRISSSRYHHPVILADSEEQESPITSLHPDKSQAFTDEQWYQLQSIGKQPLGGHDDEQLSNFTRTNPLHLSTIYVIVLDAKAQIWHDFAQI